MFAGGKVRLPKRLIFEIAQQTAGNAIGDGAGGVADGYVADEVGGDLDGDG